MHKASRCGEESDAKQRTLGRSRNTLFGHSKRYLENYSERNRFKRGYESRRNDRRNIIFEGKDEISGENEDEDED